jgi:hypothetical protein
MGNRHLRARAITSSIVRLDSGSSRVFACTTRLRPRSARLTPLTIPRSSPVLGQYVMARQVHGRLNIGIQFERTDQIMNTTSITPWIGVTIGRDTRLFYGYITTAPAALDAPATITLSTAPLTDQSELALDEFAFDSCRARTPARLILVDAAEQSHQKRRCRQHGHLIAQADPALAELNTLEGSLWYRLGVSLEHQHTRCIRVTKCSL